VERQNPVPVVCKDIGLDCGYRSVTANAVEKIATEKIIKYV
jgi:hypothetical protein